MKSYFIDDRDRCLSVPLANIELCDNKNFRLIIVTRQAEKP